MDEQAKKAALRTIPYGLYLVGVRAAEVEDPARDLNVFLGSWVSQCSFRPPLVMLGVRKDTRSHAMIAESRVLVLNFLGADQKDLAAPFLKAAVFEGGRVNGTPYRLGATGAPVLEALPRHLECRVVAIHDVGGDHDVVVAEVVEAGHREAAPLTHAETGWVYAG